MRHYLTDGLLVLSTNYLPSLQFEFFSGLTQLEYLGLHGIGLERLPATAFSELSSLQRLRLGENSLSSVPGSVFSGLGSLQILELQENRLRSLPDGIFEGLTNLKELRLEENQIQPLPLPISLEKVADGQFKAVSRTGAPIALSLPINISDTGMTGDDVNFVTIPLGSRSSELMEVSRVEGTVKAVTVDIGELPALPDGHLGYAFEKDSSLPRVILPGPREPPPAQVTGVQVTAGAEQLEVLWTRVSDAAGYRVQWKSGDEEYDDTRNVVISGADTTNYNITDLTAGKEYTVRVLATKDNADDGPPSVEVAGVPTAAQAGQVMGVEITVGVEQLKVSWIEVADASGYEVRWKSGDEDYGEVRQAVLTGADIVTHTIMDLTAGTEYTVCVIATRELAEDGEPSDEVTGIPKAQTPAQVTGVTAEPGLEELDVSWIAVSDADGYKVQWKSGTEDYDEDRQVALLGGETTSYTIIDLSADTEYTIRVIATREHADDGEPSEEVTATPVSADPDVNSDGTLDGNDALILYHSYASSNRLGDGETGGNADSRQTLLAGYSGKADPTDDELKAMIRKAHAWKEGGVSSGGDINEDGEIDGKDAFVMYYAYTNANLVGDGETGGSERFRRLLLASYAAKDDPTDEDLKAMLKRANQLREDFG